MENALVGLVCPATMENAPLLAPRVHHQSDAPTAAETSARSRSIPAPGATAPAARGANTTAPAAATVPTAAAGALREDLLSRARSTSTSKANGRYLLTNRAAQQSYLRSFKVPVTIFGGT